jgi:hypothetical protein
MSGVQDTINRALNHRLLEIRNGLILAKQKLNHARLDCDINSEAEHDAEETVIEYEEYEREYITALEYVQVMFEPAKHIIERLLRIADQCEAGGHKSRARMFRAVAEEMKVKFS